MLLISFLLAGKDHGIVPGAVTFASRESLLKTSTVSPPGTVAYLIDEEAILVKVTNGWKYIMVN